MVLYLKANDFMILRSKDLKNWKKTQVLTLDQASECPDLREVPVEGGGQQVDVLDRGRVLFPG